MEAAYNVSTKEVLAHFKVSEQGLSATQVAALREEHGRNGRNLSSNDSR
jgi:hypothetical protein